MNGDFRTVVAVYVSPLNRCKELMAIVRRLTVLLGTRALVSDESLNPYTMALVEGETSARSVSLDPQSLDERDEYRLSPCCSA